MSLANGPLPWSRIVFVADTAPPGDLATAPEMRFDLEKTDRETRQEVMGAIAALGVEVIHIEGPRELIDAAPALTGALVFSTFGGERSRNRLLLVPAIAESLSMDFVGMDAMGHALAADKLVSKRLAADCGVVTPKSRVIRTRDDLALCREFPLPYVLKPIAEGSSIGIGQQNLIREAAAGEGLATALLDRFGQPVLVEAFVPGREVSLVCIEKADGWHEVLVEVRIEGHLDYFDDHLFDADEKQARRLPRSIALVPEPLPEADLAAIHRFLHSVGHFGYGRVDGKLHQGRFHFLELTPDAWLGRRGHLGEGFRQAGWSYEQVIAEVLRSALLRPRGPVAND